METEGFNEDEKCADMRQQKSNQKKKSHPNS